MGGGGGGPSYWLGLGRRGGCCRWLGSGRGCPWFCPWCKRQRSSQPARQRVCVDFCFWDLITPMHQPSCSHLKRMYRSSKVEPLLEFRSSKVEPWGCMGSSVEGSGGFWSNAEPGGGRRGVKAGSSLTYPSDSSEEEDRSPGWGTRSRYSYSAWAKVLSSWC